MDTCWQHDFLLDPAIHFLNHGSFGACPRPVFQAYQHWQAELERQPVEFLGRRAAELLAESRAVLAKHVGAGAADVVYFPNPTTAINMVARNMMGLSGNDWHRAGAFPQHPSGAVPALAGDPRGVLRLRAGDEILTTDHEYGAMDRTWRYICRHVGARYVQCPMPLPVTTHADFAERFWAGVTGRTRIIFISHITSSTALTFPVAEICRRAREAGILTIVDGAHAPGQVPLNLANLGADIYAGACHKWLCAPKGAAFLYARPEIQPWLEPLVVSWGWESDLPGRSRFVDWHEWQGTRDIAAYLAVPAAIAFQDAHDWELVRRRCHVLAVQTRRRIVELTGLPPICPDDATSAPQTFGMAGAPTGLAAAPVKRSVNQENTWFTQFFAARLPVSDLDTLKARLHDEYRVEVPMIRWSDQSFVRVSFQAYNDQADADALIGALARLLPELRREP